jgi:hypothetical protein
MPAFSAGKIAKTAMICNDYIVLLTPCDRSAGTINSAKTLPCMSRSIFATIIYV